LTIIGNYGKNVNMLLYGEIEAVLEQAGQVIGDFGSGQPPDLNAATRMLALWSLP
jgi:hypothetical protein